jgi:ADP-ribosylglycohydrolase
MAESSRFEPVTEAEKEDARQAIEQLKRDLAEAAKRPRPPVYSPGKFTEPLGLDAHGNLQPPLSAAEIAEREDRRRRTRDAGEPRQHRAAAGRPEPRAATPDTAAGCLFGLAYGDALGKPTEFLTVAEIVARYGPAGPRTLSGDPALVTDDTQMTLAVGRALRDAGRPTPQTVIPQLRQQFQAWAVSPDNTRAPGNTCLNAIANLSRGLAWPDATIVGSKGCGANMRVAPAGLVPGYDLTTVAAVAQVQAALTHGHPTALAASELTAYAVRVLRDGAALTALPTLLRDRCHSQRTVYYHDWLGPLWERAGAAAPADYIAAGWQECLDVLDRLDAALPRFDGSQDPCRYTGEGWIAEEALATALLCAIRLADDPVGALARGAATAGDSDSIACLAGAFLGAAFGMAVWPAPWAEQIEYRDELAALGRLWDGT